MQMDPEVITTAHKALDILKFLVGGLVVIVVWAWKASKDHSRVALLRNDHEVLKGRVGTIDERLDDFITAEQHVLMQKRCQDHIARVQAEKLHAAVMAMKNDNAAIREDMAVMNANICKLLGRFDVEPVRSHERKRSTDSSDAGIIL